MAINIIKVKITKVAPANKLLCPPGGAKFTLTITVTGNEKGRADTYDLEVFAKKPWWRRDVKLDQLVNNGTAPNPKNGLFSGTHNVVLNCDNNCTIAGKLATSGDNPCDVYAYVTTAQQGWVNQSQIERLECVHPEDEDEETSQSKKKVLAKEKPKLRTRKAG